MPLAGLNDPFLKIQYKNEYQFDVSKFNLLIYVKTNKKDTYYKS